MCKENDPCYGCTKRSVTSEHNCHSDCPEYKIFRDAKNERNETIRKKKAEEAMMTDVRIRSIERTTKPITTKWKG
ncbi:MAG: hypothetical protein II306_04015 [Clostridia bacterium]|nr:hypothetical protein [Clostridia bacterium]